MLNDLEVPMAAERSEEVSEEELVARAQRIAPTLVPQQAEVEKRTFYSEETHELFRQAGFYRILTPKRYGGLEFGVDVFYKVVAEIASGCPSTGWMLCLGASHALNIASLFDQTVQDTVFASPDFIGPCVQKLAGTATPLPDGNWEISGTFSYCSGAPYSNWFIGRAAHVEDGTPVLFIASSDKYTRLDDWGGQLGMKGTGSHSLRLEKANIPGHLIHPGLDIMAIDVSKGTVGSRLHGNKLYAGSAASFFLGNLSLIALGIARNALDAYEGLMHKNVTFGPPGPRTHDPFYQRSYGTAAGKVMAGETMIMRAAENWMTAARESAFTLEFDMRLLASFREASDLLWDAMEIMLRTAGTSNLADGTRMQRAWRDMSTLRSHNGVVFFFETNKEMLTRARFNIQ